MTTDTSEKKNGFNQTEVHLAADLAGLVSGLGSYISLGASMDGLEYEVMIKAVVKAKFAPEIERIDLLCSAARAHVVAATARAGQLKLRLGDIPQRVPQAAPRAGLPHGLDRLIFFSCVVVAAVVSMGDGINATLLAARQLQSLLAGAAFLLPALCAPLLAKACLARLPARARFWAELLLGLLGLGTAGFFMYEFVAVFTTPISIDESAAGSGVPGMKFVYLSTLALGFLVVYFLISKALSLVRPGPHDEVNPEYTACKAELTAVEDSLVRAQAEVDLHQPRLRKVETYSDYLVRFALGAAAAKQKLLDAEAKEAEARASARTAAAKRDWANYGALLGSDRAAVTTGSVRTETMN